MTRALKFVSFARVEDHLRLGWMIAIPNRPMHHHYYGIEMKCDLRLRDTSASEERKL